MNTTPELSYVSGDGCSGECEYEMTEVFDLLNGPTKLLISKGVNICN